MRAARACLIRITLYQPDNWRVKELWGSRMNWDEVVQHVRSGGLVIYPTETLYALGCMSTHGDAVEKIFRIKERDQAKSLPLIVADWNMVETFVRLDQDALALAQKFWPGSLSLVAPVADEISPLACGRDGRAAVRMSPHPVARALCQSVGVPLVATSANRSGQESASTPQELAGFVAAHPELIVLTNKPWPGGGLPSTLVVLCGPAQVRILRHGAVPASLLRAAGYDCV